MPQLHLYKQLFSTSAQQPHSQQHHERKNLTIFFLINFKHNWKTLEGEMSKFPG